MKLTHLFEGLTRDKIQAIHKKNPSFFSNERYFKHGVEGGVHDFVWELEPHNLSRYIDGDFTIRRYKNKEGRDVHIGLFETILSGDTWDLWDCNSYDGDWESALDYHINSENEERIKQILHKIITDEGKDPEEYSDLTLQDMIMEVDEDRVIVDALRDSICSAEADSYHNYIHDQLKSACEEYGEVVEFNDRGVHIKIDFKNFIESIFDKDYMRDEDVIDGLERCEYDSECFFEEMLDPYGEKPKFQSDDRWYPDIDDKNFNMILEDRLYEIG